MSLEPRSNGIAHEVSRAGADEVELPLSREDEKWVRFLAEELREPMDLVAESYGRELARLRRSARVMTFLPLVVSRLVRRRGVKRRPHASRSSHSAGLSELPQE
jgi:hypothetical protein